MHLLGLVFVAEPLAADVEKAMEPFHLEHWDGWRVGGRCDGWLQGDAEQKARRTSNGFNFDTKHEDIASNSMTVCDFVHRAQPDRLPSFFVCDGRWTEEDFRQERDTLFAASFREALDRFPHHYVVVVDAHV